jgi:hypothetical protein
VGPFGAARGAADRPTALRAAPEAPKARPCGAPSPQIPGRVELSVVHLGGITRLAGKRSYFDFIEVS